MKFKNGRGGKREGAGRKATGAIRKSVRLFQSNIDKIKAYRRKYNLGSDSEAVREIIDNHEG